MTMFYNPVNVLFDNESHSRLNHQIKKEDFNRVLVITWNQEVAERKIGPLIQNNSNERLIIEFNESNPNLSDLLNIANETKTLHYDCIIAIGGGSVIDIAKALISIKNLEFYSKEDVREIITKEKYKNNISDISLIAIPTTSGTGSEVTAWSTIWDEELNLKYSINDAKLFPKQAIISPALTIGLPERTTISTSLDALCHATEAYWARNTNYVSRALSIQAIETIINELLSDSFSLSSYSTRDNLAKGSLLAGLSFSNTKTTACHAISYPLTMGFNIDHGIAVSLTLGKLFMVNKNEIIDLDKLLKAYSVENVEDVQKKLIDIYDRYDINYKLSDYKVDISDARKVAKYSMTKGRIDNNPVSLSENQIEDILKSII